MTKQTYWAEWHEFHIAEQKDTEIIPRRADLLGRLYEEITEEHFQQWSSTDELCQELAEDYGVAYEEGEYFFLDYDNELIGDVNTAYSWWMTLANCRKEGILSYDYREEVKNGIIHSILGRLNRMGKKSHIQWTDATWNVAVGCTKVDADCKYCYMYRQSLKGTRYNPRAIRKTKTVFDLPLRLEQGQRIFTSSLTDFFLPELDAWRDEAWDIMRRAPQHTYQILTKRPERIMECLPPYWDEIRNTVWLGTSAGHQAAQHRIRTLVAPIQPGIKFLSIEPLHENMKLGLHEPVDSGHRVGDLIDWIIIGGESGNETGKYRYRPCRLEWIGDIMREAEAFQIPVFVKQLGTHLAKEMKLKDRHGGDIDEWPSWLQKRRFPLKDY